MAHRAHVPKFGSWDGDNVPYTAYFENARKEKTDGVRINPNDPEQNPEAFGIGGQRRGVNSKFSQASMLMSLDDQVAPKKYVDQRNFQNQRRSATRTTMASESSSDRSLSDNSVASVLKPSHQPKKSDRNKYTNDDDLSCRSVSVPKFGEWDEKDPRSAEGFTVIFNKVKEEKHIAASRFPPVPLQTVNNNYPTNQKKETKKKFCCLF